MTSAMLHYPLLKINARMAEPLISVAPMMGCTDRHFRYLLRLISPRALLYTEMVTTGALLNNDPGRFLEHRADEPAALQFCLLYTSPSPRDGLLSRMPSSA